MKLRLSPSTVIAAIALLAALGGTAFAAGAFTKQQKKQVTKIATGVANQLLPGASVRHANSADSAATAGRADTATKALEATTAAKANEATKATEAATAQKATEATTAQRVPEANKATRADRVPQVPRATSAANAEALAGQGPAALQRSLGAACPGTSSIVSITPQGEIQCSSPVRQFQLLMPAGVQREIVLGTGLRAFVNCTDAPGSFLRLAGTDSFPAKLHLSGFQGDKEFARSDPLSTPTDTSGFLFLSPRLEGQAIFETRQTVSTVLLHAFEGAGFCEVGGTVVTAVG